MSNILDDGLPADVVRFAGDASPMFDALGEPRTRHVRVTLEGNHCVMRAINGDSYLKEARADGDESAYVVSDVYLSEREFEDLPEHDGF